MQGGFYTLLFVRLPEGQLGEFYFRRLALGTLVKQPFANLAYLFCLLRSRKTYHSRNSAWYEHRHFGMKWQVATNRWFLFLTHSRGLPGCGWKFFVLHPPNGPPPTQYDFPNWTCGFSKPPRAVALQPDDDVERGEHLRAKTVVWSIVGVKRWGEIPPTVVWNRNKWNHYIWHAPSKTNMTGWKITMFNRKYIFIHGGLSNGHVGFQGGTSWCILGMTLTTLRIQTPP